MRSQTYQKKFRSCRIQRMRSQFKRLWCGGFALTAIFGMLTGYPIQFLITPAATSAIAAFLETSGDLFYGKLLRILPTLTGRKRALQIVYDIEYEVSAHVFTLSAINICLGAVVAIVFHFFGHAVALSLGCAGVPFRLYSLCRRCLRHSFVRIHGCCDP